MNIYDHYSAGHLTAWGEHWQLSDRVSCRRCGNSQSTTDPMHAFNSHKSDCQHLGAGDYPLLELAEILRGLPVVPA
jgi:ribosomal protein L37E